MPRLLLLALLLLSPAWATARAEEPSAMVAAANPLAAAAGVAILEAGGNAMDAAVAVQFVLGLVEPQASGLGGGAFLLHYDAASGAVTSWDGRETAPAAARADLFLDAGGEPLPFYKAVLSGRSVGVPGAIAMLQAAQRTHGKLRWDALAEPAIRLAREGFPVSPRLAEAIARDADRLRRQDAARTYFFTPDGTPLPAGTRLANPAYADALRAIADQGSAALLRGPIAADIVAAIRADPNPGGMTEDDLAGYTPKQRAPVCGRYRAHTICGMGPPSSGGGAVLQILGVLAHFDLAHLDPAGAEVAHLLVEAERLAFADREQYLADPDFVRIPQRGLIAPDYLALRAQAIDRLHAMPPPRAGNPSWETPPEPRAPQPAQAEHGTSHVCIVDAQGNAVSLTTTIEDVFGARLMVRGFLLNNELTDFSFRPEIDGVPVANRVEPGKRPRSSMAPTLVFDQAGQLEACAGSAGGARIIGYVSRALVGMLDWRLSPQAAVALPHALSIGPAAELEADTPAAELAPQLQARGHAVKQRPLQSGTQAILITPSGLVGSADPRREGVALSPP